METDARAPAIQTSPACDLFARDAHRAHALAERRALVVLAERA
jgi:hypothetical protein